MGPYSGVKGPGPPNPLPHPCVRDVCKASGSKHHLHCTSSADAVRVHRPTGRYSPMLCHVFVQMVSADSALIHVSFCLERVDSGRSYVDISASILLEAEKQMFECAKLRYAVVTAEAWL